MVLPKESNQDERSDETNAREEKDQKRKTYDIQCQCHKKQQTHAADDDDNIMASMLG